EDNNTNRNNFEKENISIDVPFDNCLDESIEDEDSYICEIYLDLLKDFDESSTEYDGIARIGINIVLSVSNNSSNNKITSLDFESVMSAWEHCFTEFNYILSITIISEYINTFLIKRNNLILFNKNVSIVSEIEKIVALLIDSMYSKNNVNYHALNTIYTIVKYYSFDFVFHIDYYFDRITDYLYFKILSSLSISFSDEETESKIQKKNLANYSNYNPENRSYYFIKLSINLKDGHKKLLEYITTEDSDFSPLFKVYNYIDSQYFMRHTPFLKQANIDFHGIKIFDLRKTIIFLLDCISNLLNTFTDCRSSSKHNKYFKRSID
uniref:Uncharacterized protein n=1 Tax=Strongyloides stercoralis TaxID=6248 RepID=A0AAF5I4Q9_STRER